MWPNLRALVTYVMSVVLIPIYEVCSNSIRIGIVVVVHWVGCVCSQSWHVCTCLSNSWHKLQVAVFAQLAVLGRESNTCVYVIAIFTMYESTEQRICIKFCFKIRKTTTETYQLLQQAYGEDAMGRTQVFDWFHRFKEGRTSVESDPRSGWQFFDSEGIIHNEYAPAGQTINKDSTWRSCDVCVNQFTKNDRKNGGMATGSCTTTMRPTHFTSCAAVFGQTRHHSVTAAAILTRSRTVWLFPIPKA